ncbi:MAG: cation-translocating P-type ATPase [Acidimicrobiales bacterium]
MTIETDRGLSAAEAARRLAANGANELIGRPRPGARQLLVRQLANTMTVLLAVAAAVTLSLGHYTDAMVIALIVVLTAVLGFIQEYRSDQAIAALEQLSSPNARVVRDGRICEVPSIELVVGDLVDVGAGDVVPADLRLVDAHALRVNEAALTGESEAVPKLPDELVLRGTAITFGRATGTVVATGMRTELGRIASLLQGGGTRPTPLQNRLGTLGRQLASVSLVICAVVFAVGMAVGEPASSMFLISVSLAVAAIPEGLPAVVTVALALGARRMADRRALIRRLPAVETLGSVNIICTDKTGTLTQNRMMVERVWTPQGLVAVTGVGYDPEGALECIEGSVAQAPLLSLARVAAACNDATLHPPRSEGDEWSVIGDPTEAALLTFADKVGVDREDLLRRHPRRGEIPFDPTRRRMTTAHADGDGIWIAVKGALSDVIPLLGPEGSEEVPAALAASSGLADQGFRVLAFAERRVEGPVASPEDHEKNLRLLGLVGMTDPPRPEVADAIARCRRAGITPIMITGDHARTALAIAHRLGLIDNPGDEVLTGVELDTLDDAALVDRVEHVRVYARTNPEQKVRIVQAWQTRGAVVAMTGDGVNDAPALELADIGVAMGITGTEVSKEAADIILADDNFATIVAAVEEGRRIYDNIRRFVRYLLTTNSGEIWVMLLAPVFGLPFPLTAIQILWINLVTDGLPAMALGLEPVAPDTMQRPPRPPRESILSGGLWQRALVIGLVMAVVTIPLQGLARSAGRPWATMVFTTIVFLQLGNALAMRSERRSAFRISLRSNPTLVGAVLMGAIGQLVIIYVPAFHDILDTRSLDGIELGVVVLLSTAGFIAVELDKWRLRAKSPRVPGGAYRP